MKKVFLGILILVTATQYCLAMAEAPKKQAIAPAPGVEATAEEQYNRAYRQYLIAEDTKYDKYIQYSIDSFEKYLQYFPSANQKINALYFLSRNYKLIGKPETQEKYLLQYEAEVATTVNVNKDLADIDLAGIYALNGKSVEAKQMYDTIFQRVSNNNELVAQIYIDSLPLYEIDAVANQKILISMYAFLIQNGQYLPSRVFLSVYSYKLAQLYDRSGDKKSAKMYYEIVVKENHPQAKDMVESAKLILEKKA